MADNKINVGGRLHSIATGNVLGGADEIFDDSKNKKQSEINTETYSLVNDVNERLSGLSPDQQSALSVAAKATNNETKLGYYVCDTEGNVAAKVISDATGYVLSPGGSMKVKMTNANTANNATLNINSTGAKALYYAGEIASAKNSWEAGETVEVYYDGTSYYANSVAGGSGVYVENPEFIRVVTDKEDKILYGVKSNGDFYFGAGCPPQVKDYVQAQIDILMGQGDITEKIDTINEMIAFFDGIRHDETLQNLLQASAAAVAAEKSRAEIAEQALFTTKVDKEEGKSLIDLEFAEGVSHVDNPEFVYVKTDAEGKILWAIKTDGSIYYGAGVPQQVIDYIEKKIADLSLDEYEDIVAFLLDYLGSDTTLKVLIDSKLDAEGLDPDALETVQVAENPEYIQVTTDSENKILEGITSDGVKKINLPIDTPSTSIKPIENPEFVEVKIDSKGNLLEGIKEDGTKSIPLLEVGNAKIKELTVDKINETSKPDNNIETIDLDLTGWVLNDAYIYTAFSGPHLNIEPTKGIGYVTGLSSKTGYSEAGGNLVLAVFPCLQPYRCEFFDIAKTGDVDSDGDTLSGVPYDMSSMCFYDANDVFIIRSFFVDYNGYHLYYRDFNTETKQFVSAPVKVKYYDGNNQLANVTDEAITAWVEAHGGVWVGPQKNIFTNHIINDKTLWNDGDYIYSVLTVAQYGNPVVVKSDDNFATLHLVTLLPYRYARCETAIAKLNGTVYILYRGGDGNIDGTFFQTTQDFVTYSEMVLLPNSNTIRPEILVNNDNVYLFFGTKVSDDRVVQRGSYDLWKGIGSDLSTYQKEFRLSDKFGIVYASAQFFNGRFLFAYSANPLMLGRTSAEKLGGKSTMLFGIIKDYYQI